MRASSVSYILFSVWLPINMLMLPIYKDAAVVALSPYRTPNNHTLLIIRLHMSLCNRIVRTVTEIRNLLQFPINIMPFVPQQPLEFPCNVAIEWVHYFNSQYITHLTEPLFMKCLQLKPALDIRRVQSLNSHNNEKHHDVSIVGIISVKNKSTNLVMLSTQVLNHSPSDKEYLLN